MLTIAECIVDKLVEYVNNYWIYYKMKHLIGFRITEKSEQISSKRISNKDCVQDLHHILH